MIPHFSGQSYISYPSLTNAHAVTTLLVEIRPINSDGLVLYNGQLGGPDFIAVELVSGRVAFSYSLGPETSVTIWSSSTLELDQWHSIEVHRNGRSGQLIVDNAIPVSGTAGPDENFNSLQLGDDLFLGGISNFQETLGQVDSTVGFTGCIRELRTGSTLEQVDLIGDALEGAGITECSILSPCERYQCLNGGTCIESGDSFVCNCPIEFTGTFCEALLCEASNPCQNNGVCMVESVNGSTQQLCDCSLPYGGDTCTESEPSHLLWIIC